MYKKYCLAIALIISTFTNSSIFPEKTNCLEKVDILNNAKKYPLTDLTQYNIFNKTEQELQQEGLLLDLYMYQSYKAYRCTNTKLLSLFNDILNELELEQNTVLFIATDPPSSLPERTPAFYSPSYQAIVLVEKYFFDNIDIWSIFTIYHEIRHHLQYLSNDSFSTATNLMLEDNLLTHNQACEFDADYFAAQHCTQGCPTCLKLLQLHFPETKPYPYSGYFTKDSAKSIIAILENENPTYCSFHDSIQKRLECWIKNLYRPTMLGYELNTNHGIVAAYATTCAIVYYISLTPKEQYHPTYRYY